MQQTRYEFYVGLKHQDNLNVIVVEKAREDLEKFFQEYKIDFSLNYQKGGYVHENGTYIVEDGVKITIIGDYNEDTVKNFIEGIKEIYNQESVLLITKAISTDFN